MNRVVPWQAPTRPSRASAGELVKASETLHTCQMCGRQEISRNMRSVFFYALGGILSFDDATGEKYPIAYWCDKCVDDLAARVKAARERFTQLSLPAAR